MLLTPIELLSPQRRAEIKESERDDNNNDGLETPIAIYNEGGWLNFGEMGRLATTSEVIDTPFDVGGIWDGIEDGDILQLQDGLFLVVEL